MSVCVSCGKSKCPGDPECGLLYISQSPPREHGGFHPNTVAIAKSALRLIRKLRREISKR